MKEYSLWTFITFKGREQWLYKVLRRYLLTKWFLYLSDESNSHQNSLWHRRQRQQRLQRHNKNRRRRKNQNIQNRISGCQGTCKNMFSCMLTGQKVDWEAPGKSCPGMLDACCTSWSPRKKYSGTRIKSGRSLGLFSPQVQVWYIPSHQCFQLCLKG